MGGDCKLKVFSWSRYKKILLRNQYSIKGTPSKKNKVNIECYPLYNIGDTLGPIVVKWMLSQRGLDEKKIISHTRHLISIGSVINQGSFDATVWGSGILSINEIGMIRKKRQWLGRKFDIRAVRGPLTRDVLLKAGYTCGPIYGDPAILMPLIYKDSSINPQYDVSLILHYRSSVGKCANTTDQRYVLTVDQELIEKNKVHMIDPKTDDYKQFINEISASKLVISSSLHGIILAEAYGVPAIFLNFGMDDQQTKFEDWYQSTGREVISCTSLEDALCRNVPKTPKLNKMQDDLMNSFPYDLWE